MIDVSMALCYTGIKWGSEVPTDRWCYPGTKERREKPQVEVPEPQKVCQMHFQR